MYGRTGTLFEERFKALEVDSIEYCIHLCRYIHRNPLEAGLVNDLEQWEYSNYLEWIGKRNGSLVDREFVKSHFINGDAYKEFVLNYTGGKKFDFRF